MTPPRRACLLSGARKKISVRTALTRTARGDREERRGQEPPRTDRCQLRHRARPHFIFPFSTHQGAMLWLPPGMLLPRVGEAVPNLAAGPPSPWVFFLSIARHGGTCTSPWAGVSPWTPGRTGCKHGHGAAPRETQPRCWQRSGCHIHSSARPMALGGTPGGPRPGSPWARSHAGAAEGSHRLGRGLGTGPRFYTHFRFELTSTHRDIFTSLPPRHRAGGELGPAAPQRASVHPPHTRLQLHGAAPPHPAPQDGTRFTRGETWVPPAGFADPTAAGLGHPQWRQNGEERAAGPSPEYNTGNFCCSEMEKVEQIAGPALPVRDKMRCPQAKARISRNTTQRLSTELPATPRGVPPCTLMVQGTHGALAARAAV